MFRFFAIACWAGAAFSLQANTLPADETAFSWIPAIDKTQVTPGEWYKTSFRYAQTEHLGTHIDHAEMKLTFEGTGIAMRMANSALPVYGSVCNGLLFVSIDDEKPFVIEPKLEPLEVVLARGLKPGKHSLSITHKRREDGGKAARVEGFLVWNEPRGELEFNITGEDQEFLVEARAILTKDGKEIRNTLLRNWISGRCRLTALPPGEGYSLSLAAIGWEPVSIENISIKASEATKLPDIRMLRNASITNTGIDFPALNQPVIRKAGESFPIRFPAADSQVKEIIVKRTVGPAVISRKLNFTESSAEAQEGTIALTAKLPANTPPGLYDLHLTLLEDGKETHRQSPRTMHVVTSFPKNPVFFTFGHLDTSSQYQAEYLQRVCQIANLIGPDFVLNSNAVNPGYITGAMATLDIPYVVNFGNHRFKNHAYYYGDQVGIIDFGPGLSILNFGHKWNVDLTQADELLSARKDVTCKVINAFESDAPVEFIDKHQIRMLHDAHGDGKRVMLMGSTPTQRIGKINAVSFRVVRFEDNRVISCTYQGHETDPIPFARDEKPPLRSEISPANDGTHDKLTATITNDYLDPFPNCRVTFVLPAGKYQADGGRIESAIRSDDGKYTVLAVRADVPAEQSVQVNVKPSSAK